MILFLVSSHHWFPSLLVFESEMSSESSCVKSLAPSAAVLGGGTPRGDPIHEYDNVRNRWEGFKRSAWWERKVTRAVLLKDVLYPVSSLPVCSLAAMWIGVSSATHPYLHNSLPPAKPKATESADHGLKSVQMNQKRTFFPIRFFISGIGKAKKFFAFGGSQCRGKETNSL